ncbi:thioredoxin family protein [Candidatus Thioglobus sp.]|uniref:thioredoxin family protein n=1 Tax=Candidatus Thioglobus sp. TaxID=2026721 RepID=UPI003D14EE06
MFEIKVLGDCVNCKTTQELIEAVASENGITIKLEKLVDIKQIASYGITSSPAIIVNEKIVHAGSVPDKKTILSWFKSLCCPTDDQCC